MSQTNMGKTLEIVEVKISELKPALYNPRKISDKDFAQLIESINQFNTAGDEG